MLASVMGHTETAAKLIAAGAKLDQQNKVRDSFTHAHACTHTHTHARAFATHLQHWNLLQHTAPMCNTLQHTATHCNTLQHYQPIVYWLPPCISHNTLQHTTTNCTSFSLSTYWFALAVRLVSRVPQCVWPNIAMLTQICFVFQSWILCAKWTQIYIYKYKHIYMCRFSCVYI